MKKFFTTSLILLASFGLLKAQVGYLRFLNDTVISEKNFFKGEIFPLSKDQSINNLYVFIMGSDTFKVINNVMFLKKVLIDKTSLKNDLIKSKGKNSIYIDLSSVYSNGDTIWFVTEQEQKIPLVEKQKVTFNIDETGNSFRLIIPNSPSIYYTFNDLINIKEGFLTNLSWWHYLVLTIVLIILGFVFWRYQFKNNTLKIKVPKTAKYSGGSLSDFAKENRLSKSKLIKLNQGVIPSNYESMNDSEKKDLHRDLKKIGYLTIDYNDSSDQLGTDNSGFGQFQRDEASEKELDFEIEQKDNSKQLFLQNQINISQQLSQLESNIIREIRSAVSKSNENSNLIDRLNDEIDNLKNINKKYSDEKQNLESSISQLSSDKNKFELMVESLQTEITEKNIEHIQLQEKVISVDFLIEYCDCVWEYFNLCNQVMLDAYEYANRINRQNPQQGTVTGQLLINFQNSVNPIPVGNWMQIVQDIKDTGVSNNSQIKNSFKQLENIDDRKKQFQRLLFSEVLVKYSSSILILAEAYRNIGRFQISNEIALEIQNAFTKHIQSLLNKIKTTGMENKYIPLFRDFEDFLGQIESVDRGKYNAYKEISGLKKGAIAEIVSYGVKTPFEETKTLIILE